MKFIRAAYVGDPFRLWSVVMPILLAFGFWWTQALYGFAPVDDGAMLAQAWRIAEFQIPHVDFDSIRPTGSALLHAPLTLLPWGMLAIDRLIVVLQLLWVMVAGVSLLDPHRRLTPLQAFALVAISFFIGIGTWPVMAWHTIDGLFIGMTAVWLAARPIWNREGLRWSLVWLLAGFAPLTKQGFGIVPLAVLLVIVGMKRWKGLLWLPLGLTPGLLYLVLTWGAPGSAIGQITRTSSPGETFTSLWSFLAYVQSLEGVLVVGLTVAALVAATSTSIGLRQRVLVSSALYISASLWPAFTDRLDVYTPWSFATVVSVALVATITCRSRRQLTVTAAFLVLAYSVSVSRGVDNPGLMAGLLFVTGLLLLLRVAAREQETVSQSRAVRKREARPYVTILIVLLAVFSLGLSWISRAAWVFAEPPRAQLTASVDHPSFALIRMSERTSAYVDSVIACIGRYPAKRTAVIPDGPALYALFQLDNPFRTDWFAPGEIDYYRTGEGEAVHAANVNATIEELNASEDWLVLMQTRPFNFITTPEEAVDPIEPVAYWPNDETIIDRLQGQSVSCGSLIGKYRPASGA